MARLTQIESNFNELLMQSFSAAGPPTVPTTLPPVAPRKPVIRRPRRSVKSGLASMARHGFEIRTNGAECLLQTHPFRTRRALWWGTAMSQLYQSVAILLSLFVVPPAWAEEPPSKQIAARTELHQIQSLTLRTPPTHLIIHSARSPPRCPRLLKARAIARFGRRPMGSSSMSSRSSHSPTKILVSNAALTSATIPARP